MTGSAPHAISIHGLTIKTHAVTLTQKDKVLQSKHPNSKLNYAIMFSEKVIRNLGISKTRFSSQILNIRRIGLSKEMKQYCGVV